MRSVAPATEWHSAPPVEPAAMMAGFSLGPRYLFRWCVITRRGRISGSAHARYYEVHDPYRSRQLVVVFNRPKLPSNKLARTLFRATVNLLQNDHREVSG